jgi:membrane protease YdiL (CAAX protease family)
MNASSDFGADQPEHSDREAPSDSGGVPAKPVQNDPFAYDALGSQLRPAGVPELPADLQTSWSWGHFTLFIFFCLASFITVQLAAGILIFRAVGHQLTQKQLQRFLENRPEYLVGVNLVWFGAIVLFLYVTLAALNEVPFWTTLGWRRVAVPSGKKLGVWKFLLGGAALSLLIAGLGSRVRTPDNLPIQDLFKSRTGTMLLMAMAVFVAPLVEETVFRGYLYPLLAKSFGVRSGILVTGVLFGLMHGQQLGWTWWLVVMLMVVGVVFTWVRARTGTVLASFLMHLGYNGAIAISSIIITHGFTRLPPMH